MPKEPNASSPARQYRALIGIDFPSGRAEPGDPCPETPPQWCIEQGLVEEVAE